MGVISEYGHWPKFSEILCGNMTDRERLGLPQHYVEDRFASDQSTIYKQLYKYEPESLVKIVWMVRRLIETTHHIQNIHRMIPVKLVLLRSILVRD